MTNSVYEFQAKVDAILRNAFKTNHKNKIVLDEHNLASVIEKLNKLRNNIQSDRSNVFVSFKRENYLLPREERHRIRTKRTNDLKYLAEIEDYLMSTYAMLHSALKGSLDNQSSSKENKSLSEIILKFSDNIEDVSKEL